MVRATASGHHLEGMLDSKLRRASILKGSMPSCLLIHPDFAAFAPPVLETLVSDEVAGEVPSEAEDSSASVMPLSLQQLSAVPTLVVSSHWAHIPLPTGIYLWQL